MRGVRVGEASHPGPVQTRNARRLQSLLVDSEACTVDQSTWVDPDDDSLARSRVSRHHRLRSRGERIQVSSDDEVPHTARASTRALRDAGIASFISEAGRTQLDPSDFHSLMEHEQRGPDEVSAGAHSVSKVLGDLPSGRFAALASESGDESAVVHVCRAPSDVVHYVGVAVLATPVASAPKRLRLTSRKLGATKIPREDPQREERMKFPAGEKKKREILGPPSFRAPPFLGSGPPLRAPNPSGPTFSGFGPPTLRAPTPSSPHTTLRWTPLRRTAQNSALFFPSPATISLPAASGPPGLHTTARELQTCTFEGPGASNTTKIQREDTQRDPKRA